MPPIVCPRCQSTNPEFAVYCFNDGVVLRAGAGADAGSSRLLHEFIFPSGRRCRTYDELAQACQEEWEGARDLLRRGVFQQYFAACGRQDLARSAQEATAQTDPNLALANFLNALPGARGQGPRLDLNPRRLHLGNVLAGESRHVEVTVNNQGQGMLRGTVSVTEGGNWIRIGGPNNGQCELHTAREQRVQLQVDTRGLPAGQTYGGKLTVVSNGGVVELPVRLDLAVHPFARPPFQGARAPREMAEKMRTQPKAAVPLLESGDVARWFAANGWAYPVQGNPVKGVAGVQQFFEGLGLSKPPDVKVSQVEVRVECTAAAPVRSQVSLLTGAKKWVYANVESDSPWLAVVTPQVSGPQKADVLFEVDPRALPRGRSADGTLRLAANGGQALTVRVRAQAVGAAATVAGTAQATMKMPPAAVPTAKMPPVAVSPSGIVTPARVPSKSGVGPAPVEPILPEGGIGLLRSVLAGALFFFLLRFAVAPVADGFAREMAVRSAYQKLNLSTGSYGEWLALPWPSLLLSGEGHIGDPMIELAIPNATREFRDHFTSRFVFLLVMLTWWLGALGGGLALWRKSGAASDALWGVVAGGFAGLALGATLGCLLLAGDLLPHLVWSALFGESGNVGLLIVWVVLALVCWTALGAAVGLVLGILGPVGRPVLAVLVACLAAVLRLIGMGSAAEYFTE